MSGRGWWRRSSATTPGSSGRRWPRRSGRSPGTDRPAGRAGVAAYDRGNPPTAAASHRTHPPRGPSMTTQQEVPATDETAPANLRMVIGGERVDAAGGQTFEVINPATGKVVATAPLGGREDVDRAVAAAQKAFEDRKGWATWAAGKR